MDTARVELPRPRVGAAWSAYETPRQRAHQVLDCAVEQLSTHDEHRGVRATGHSGHAVGRQTDRLHRLVRARTTSKPARASSVARATNTETARGRGKRTARRAVSHARRTSSLRAVVAARYERPRRATTILPFARTTISPARREMFSRATTIIESARMDILGARRATTFSAPMRVGPACTTCKCARSSSSPRAATGVQSARTTSQGARTELLARAPNSIGFARTTVLGARPNALYIETARVQIQRPRVGAASTAHETSRQRAHQVLNCAAELQHTRGDHHQVRATGLPEHAVAAACTHTEPARSHSTARAATRVQSAQTTIQGARTKVLTRASNGVAFARTNILDARPILAHRVTTVVAFDAPSR